MTYDSLANLNGSNLSNLDSLGILDRRGFPSLRIGHYVDLGLFSPENKSTRDALVEIAFNYLDVFSDRVTHYLPHDETQLASIRDFDFRKYLSERVHQPYDTENHEGFSATLYGLDSDKDNEEPTTCFFNFTAATPHHRFSTISAYFPAGWPEKHGYDAYIDLIRNWCEALKPNHGTAGLSVLYNEGQQTHEDRLAAFPIIKRFIGLDIPEPSRWYTMMDRQSNRAIRTINWLTIIDYDLISKIGGKANIRNSMDESCIIHPYHGGIIIQAGDKPEIGDINQGFIPHSYRMVSRALKPISFEAYSHPLIDAPAPLDSLSETLAWVRRFD